MLFFCPWLIVDIGLVRSRSSTSASSWPSLTWKAIPLPPDPRGKNSLSLSACPTPTNPNQRSTAKPVPLNWPALLSWQSSPDSSYKTRSFSNPLRHFSSPADKAQIVFKVLQSMALGTMTFCAGGRPPRHKWWSSCFGQVYVQPRNTLRCVLALSSILSSPALQRP